jgi:hypothetical protein
MFGIGLNYYVIRIVSVLLATAIIALVGRGGPVARIRVATKHSVIEAWGNRRPGMIFEESRVPEYQLPDPFASEDGRRIANAQDWGYYLDFADGIFKLNVVL